MATVAVAADGTLFPRSEQPAGMALDAEDFQARVRSNEFHDSRGFAVESVEPRRVVVTLPRRDDLTNFSGDIHGGVLATLVDTGSALAIRSTFEDPWAPGLATTDLSVTYVRPARSEVRATAEVVRVGGSLAVASVEVTGVAPDGDRKVVATGRTTYRVYDGTAD